MRLRRRLTLQLTPLLDLLLTVIFAQYLDMRLTAQRQSRLADSDRTAMVSQMTGMMQQLQTTEADLSSKQRLAEKLQQQLVRVQEELTLHQEKVKSDNLELELSRRQVSSLIDVMKEMITLPEATWQKLHESQRLSPDSATPELERVRGEIAKLTRARGTDVLDFFLTHEELLKRADIWDLYIREDGLIELAASEQSFQFRTESTEMCASRLFEIYKSLPQPKTVVILFISYGDARAIYRQAVFDGVPKAIEHMNVDIQGRSRFEYAILGSRTRDAKPAR